MSDAAIRSLCASDKPASGNPSCFISSLSRSSSDFAVAISFSASDISVSQLSTFDKSSLSRRFNSAGKDCKCASALSFSRDVLRYWSANSNNRSFCNSWFFLFSSFRKSCNRSCSASRCFWSFVSSLTFFRAASSSLYCLRLFVLILLPNSAERAAASRS